ncbi:MULTISPECIES: D-serine ammonia-lyase [Bacillaceae]|uniref:D-serine ammonia-lyase n=1 Tax=Bacillaceae TaxID=186817 RepID=UPI00070200DF|nr:MULTISPECIES: D-serine ammonia-lyase [Bacillaceae]KQL37511.1 serine ammonia-lyase [Psychrobacillus sp. FJAT-21963]MDF2064976.1 D-serine ammonia-lyase [Bacillus sp. Cr_A10]
MNTQQLIEKFPLIKEMQNTEEVIWFNPNQTKTSEALPNIKVTSEMVQDASDRLERFAPYLQIAFPETAKANGIIESPLVAIPEMASALKELFQTDFTGELLLKCDNALPISGSIKARGGIYEVLKIAETLAIRKGLLTPKDDYGVLANDAFKKFFSEYSIAVGSTGNLGLSIGIMSAKLGFRVTVHMSSDAKQWKKDLLREKGVEVIEYAADYSLAVKEGRKQAEQDPNCFFIDDENSIDLFVGYAVAANRLKKQLEQLGKVVDETNPLYVYLPCGVGGGPGGVAFGLKLLFGDHVHCFFAEPTHSPCMLLGLMTGLHENISVHDIGLDNKTAADGLAVGRPSGFVGKTLERLIEGSYTISDRTMHQLLALLVDTEKIQLEPSALAGMTGPIQLATHGANLQNATHIVWATGGGMVPESEKVTYYETGRQFLNQ